MINFQGVKKYTVEEWKNVNWDIDGVAENPDDQRAVNAFLHCKTNCFYLKRFFQHMGWGWKEAELSDEIKGQVQ